MHTILEINRGESPVPDGVECLVAPLEAEAWTRHAPSAHFAVIRDRHLVARCSIWTDSTPAYLDKPLGVIGHYAAADTVGGAALLTHAVAQLHRRGFRSTVGPMDGNTWRRYRLLTQRGTEPPFFMEPDNPNDWPGHFTAAAFVPLAQYYSGLNDDLSVENPRAANAWARLRDAGVRIRQIDVSRFDAELQAVHELSMRAFANNFLYTPISREEFLAMYAPLQAHLRPELVLLAERDSRLLGFIFGLPDLLQARRGEPVTTAIAKSMAVSPEQSGAGLGSVLMNEWQRAARRLGFTRVIHALMHQNNASMKISARYGRPFRRYTLYINHGAA